MDSQSASVPGGDAPSPGPGPVSSAGATLARQVRWLVISGAVLVLAMAFLTFRARQGGRASERLPILREVGAFAVTNHLGARVDSGSLRGRPWAINLIFTRCPGPCATLSGVMRSIQAQLPPEARAGLMSVTSDPGYDTPEVLAVYGAKFGADPDRWQFVTASKEEIRRLATRQLGLVLEEIPEGERQSPEDLFLHSTLIVVVDGRGRLRAAIDGMEADAVSRVVSALRSLEAENDGQ